MEAPPIVEKDDPPSRGQAAASLIFVLLLVVAPLLINSIWSLQYVGAEVPPLGLESCLYLMVVGVVSVVISLVAMLISGDKLSLFGFLKWDWRRDFGLPLLLAPAFFILAFMLNYGVELVAYFTGFTQGGSNEPLSMTVPWWLLVLTLLVSALGEEISMRCVVMTRIAILSRDKWVGAVVSSLLFTSYHVYQGFVALPTVFFLGMCFAVCFMKWKSLWQIAITHCLINTLTYSYAAIYVGIYGTG